MRSDTIWRLLAEWAPMLILVGIWIYFMRGFFRSGSPYQQARRQAQAEQKRHNDALEKILESHEARLQKLEGDKRA